MLLLLSPLATAIALMVVVCVMLTGCVVLLDVVDDEPASRWLSICFYDEMVSDPGEKGDFVPGGLMGEDARCFNVDELDEDLVAYVAERIREAGAARRSRRSRV